MHKIRPYYPRSVREVQSLQMSVQPVVNLDYLVQGTLFWILLIFLKQVLPSPRVVIRAHGDGFNSNRNGVPRSPFTPLVKMMPEVMGYQGISITDICLAKAYQMPKSTQVSLSITFGLPRYLSTSTASIMI